MNMELLSEIELRAALIIGVAVLELREGDCEISRSSMLEKIKESIGYEEHEDGCSFSRDTGMDMAHELAIAALDPEVDSMVSQSL